MDRSYFDIDEIYGENEKLQDELLDRLESLSKIITESSLYLRIFNEIGENGKAIDGSGVEKAFEIFFYAIVGHITLNVYNLFDSGPKYHDIVSIPSIIDKLKTCKLIDPLEYTKALNSIKVHIQVDNKDLSNKAIEQLNKIKPSFKNNDNLKKIKQVRDNYIAHKNFDCAKITIPPQLPSHNEFDKLLQWANNFRIAVYKGYFPDYRINDPFKYTEPYTSQVVKLISIVKKGME